MIETHQKAIKIEYIDQKQNKQLSIKLKKKKTNFVIFMDLGNLLSFNW